MNIYDEIINRTFPSNGCRDAERPTWDEFVFLVKEVKSLKAQVKKLSKSKNTDGYGERIGAYDLSARRKIMKK